MFTQLVLWSLVISSIAVSVGIVVRRVRWRRKLTTWRLNWTLPTAVNGVDAGRRSRGDISGPANADAAANTFVRSPQILHRLVTAN